MGCILPVKASTSCSSVQCNRSSPSSANFLASVSPAAKACRMRSPLAPSKLLTTIDSLMRISSSRHSIWFCSRTRSRVSCTFMRVRLRQIRCSPLGTKLKISSSAISRRTSRSASLKSCLRPRGARLENACAKCKRICGSSSSHTDRQYGAVDSITASSTPCSCNQIRNRCNSLTRQRDKSSPCRLLFRRTSIHHHYHQDFLVYVDPRDLHRFLLTWKRQNARVKGYTPSRATTLPTRRMARHRLVQNARSRSNSKTASLHPERNPTCAVHAP